MGEIAVPMIGIWTTRPLQEAASDYTVVVALLSVSQLLSRFAAPPNSSITSQLAAANRLQVYPAIRPYVSAALPASFWSIPKAAIPVPRNAAGDPPKASAA